MTIDFDSPHRFIPNPRAQQVMLHLYRDPDSDSGRRLSVDVFGLRTLHDAVLAHEEVHKIYNDLTIDSGHEEHDVGDGFLFEHFNDLFDHGPVYGFHEDKDTLLSLSNYYLTLFPTHPYAIELAQNVPNCVEYECF